MKLSFLAVLVILAGCSKPAPKLPASATVMISSARPDSYAFILPAYNPLHPQIICDYDSADIYKCHYMPKRHNVLFSSEANFMTDEGKRVVIGWVGLCGTETHAYGASATTGGLPDVQITLAPCPPPPATRKKVEKWGGVHVYSNVGRNDDLDKWVKEAEPGNAGDCMLTDGKSAPCPPVCPPNTRPAGDKYLLVPEIPTGYALFCADHENCRLVKR